MINWIIRLIGGVPKKQFHSLDLYAQELLKEKNKYENKTMELRRRIMESNDEVLKGRRRNNEIHNALEKIREIISEI